jgi:hypothetical protein
MKRPVTNRDRQNRAANEARALRGRSLPVRKGQRWLRTVSLVGLAAGNILAPKVAVGQDSAGEYELKAAMLYNLTRFVEWPPSAYADAQAPTVLCILGRDPFANALTSLASNPTAGGRTVEIRQVSNNKAIRGCHVAYISSSERKNIPAIFSALKGSSALTVGETAQFAARGGMIQFSLEERQVRFEVNLEAASEAELKISSRLLLLARIVKEQNKNTPREGSALLPPPGFQVARGRGEPEHPTEEGKMSSYKAEGFSRSR